MSFKLYNKMDSRIQLVCRTCLKVIDENDAFIDAKSKTKHGVIINILEACVSELNLDFSEEVIMCSRCTKMLKISYEFRLACFNTEDKVFEYLKHYGLPVTSRVNLADVNTHFNRLEKNSVGLSSDKLRRNENVVSDRKSEANINSTRYPLEMTDMNFLRKSSNFQKNQDDNDANIVNVYERPDFEVGNPNKRDCSNGVFMFDDLAANDLDNLLNDNYSISQEDDTFRAVRNDIETVAHSQNNLTDWGWGMNVESCRLNSSREEYFDDLFEFPPCGNADIDAEDDVIEQFVFKPPLCPKRKRNQYGPNSF